MRISSCLRNTLSLLIFLACLTQLPAYGSASGDDDKMSQYEGYQHAQNLIVEKKYDEAIAVLNEALTRFPKSALGYAVRGAAQSLAERIGPALSDTETALQLSRGTPYDKIVKPLASRTYSQVGYLQCVAKQFDACLASESKAIEMDPEFPVSYVRRGYAEYKLGNYQSALTDMKRVLLDPFPTPFQILLHTWTGRCQFKLGNPEQARAEGLKLLDLDPRLRAKYSGEHMLEIYDMDLRHQRMMDSIAAAEAAEGKGSVAEAFHDYQDAWQWPLFTSAIPGQGDVDDYRAADADAVSKAGDAMRGMFARLPQRPPVPEEARRYVVQAEAELHAQRIDDAIKLYGQALAVVPCLPEVSFNLAMIEAQKGSYPDAIRDMKAYLLMEPNATDARQAQDKIYEWELGGNTSSAAAVPATAAAPAAVDLSGNWIYLNQMSPKFVMTTWATIVPTNDGAFELDPTKAAAPFAGQVPLSRNNWYMIIKINGNKLEGSLYEKGGVTSIQGEMDAGNDGFIISGVVSGKALSEHWTRQK